MGCDSILGDSAALVTSSCMFGYSNRAWQPVSVWTRLAPLQPATCEPPNLLLYRNRRPFGPFLACRTAAIKDASPKSFIFISDVRGIHARLRSRNRQMRLAVIQSRRSFERTGFDCRHIADATLVLALSMPWLPCSLSTAQQVPALCSSTKDLRRGQQTVLVVS